MPRQILLLLIVGLASAGLAAGLVFAFNMAGKDEQAVPPPVAVAAPVEAEAPKAKPVEKESDSDRLSIPKDGGLWPWPLGAAPPEAPTVSTSLTSYIRSTDPKGWKNRVSVQAARVNPGNGHAVVTASGLDARTRPKGKESWGEVFLCDLTTGRVKHQWETKKALYPFDLHRDGNRFLLRLAHGSYDLDAQVVELWEVGPGDTVRRRTWRPYFDGRPKNSQIMMITDDAKLHISAAQVKWAGFVGSEHIATLHGSTMKLWDARSLSFLASFSGVVGLPSVSPDGGKLAFLNGDAVALLDPVSLKIVSAKRLGELPPNPVLAFHPSGSKLAAIGTGRTTILDLKNGKVWQAMLADIKTESKGDWVELPPACGWASDKHIFFKGDLYDLDMPVPVWHYSWSAWANIQGRSAWAVADHPSDKQVVLRPFTIPHPTMQATLNKQLLTSNVFSLRPGDFVRIDVSGLPTSRQDDIRKTLEKRVQALGYGLDSASEVVFKAFLDTPVATSVTYDGKSYSYTAQQARLVIQRAGKELWSGSGCHTPPFLIWYNTQSSLSDVVRSYGKPDYDLYTHRPIPGVIRKAGQSGALGSSSFRAFGIEEKN